MSLPWIVIKLFTKRYWVMWRLFGPNIKKMLFRPTSTLCCRLLTFYCFSAFFERPDFTYINLILKYSAAAFWKPSVNRKKLASCRKICLKLSRLPVTFSCASKQKSNQTDFRPTFFKLILLPVTCKKPPPLLFLKSAHRIVNLVMTMDNFRAVENGSPTISSCNKIIIWKVFCSKNNCQIV